MDHPKKGFFRRFFSFLTGVIVGGAVGSILGLTLAPKRGRETREYIREHGSEWYQKGQSVLKKPEKVSIVKRIIIRALRPRKKDSEYKEL